MRRQPIVVGVAAVATPGYLLRWAALEAQRWNAPLRLVQANDTTATDTSPPYEADVAAQRHLADLAEWLRREFPGLAVTTQPRAGTPVAVLAGEADGAGLLVVGRHEQGRMAEAVFGSTAVRLASAARCPVVAVPDRVHPSPAAGPIVVGVRDDPLDALAAVRFAMRVAWYATVPVYLMHYREPQRQLFGDSPALAEVIAECRAELPSVSTHLFVVDGDPAELLPWESQQASLLVLAATRGHHGRLGRVGSAVLRHAACPVALVPATVPATAAARARRGGTPIPLPIGREAWPDIPVI